MPYVQGELYKSFSQKEKENNKTLLFMLTLIFKLKPREDPAQNVQLKSKIFQHSVLSCWELFYNFSLHTSHSFNCSQQQQENSIFLAKLTRWTCFVSVSELDQNLACNIYNIWLCVKSFLINVFKIYKSFTNLRLSELWTIQWCSCLQS